MRIRSLRGRIFLALLAIGVVPVVITLGAAAVAFRGAVDLSGTAGPWNAVAESGSNLLERIDSAGVDDPAVRTAMDEHAGALETSVRYSNLYTALARRFSGALPLVAVGFFLAVALVSLAAAGLISRGLAAPIGELVDWTGRVGRGEALPAESAAGDEGGRGASEFGRLRTAIRSMAGEIEDGRQRAVESARLRSWTEMARRVAHEIKNPLTPIQISAASLALDPRESVSEAATIILDEVHRLDELARSFSQLGRMPEGPGAPVDLVELLNGLANRHRSQDLDLVVEAPNPVPLVPGHHDALLRVFRNLIANASEAMPATGTRRTITLRVSSVAGAVEVQVLDEGPGFSEEALASIWDPEFTTKMRGTGIGLALVKGTVEGHGGRVVAENREGAGARVTVTLPSRTGVQ